MIKEDAEDAPEVALRCVFCASALFLFAIVMLQRNYALDHGYYSKYLEQNVIMRLR
jgi:hypothetical protein